MTTQPDSKLQFHSRDDPTTSTSPNPSGNDDEVIPVSSDMDPTTYNFAPTFSHLAKSIRTSSRSLRNRLKSIYEDAQFVRDVALAYGNEYPVMANRRAGEWYVDPDGVAGGGRGGGGRGGKGGCGYI